MIGVPCFFIWSIDFKLNILIKLVKMPLGSGTVGSIKKKVWSRFVIPKEVLTKPKEKIN